MTDEKHARMVDLARKIVGADDFDEAGFEDIWCQECGGEIPAEVKELAELVLAAYSASKNPPPNK